MVCMWRKEDSFQWESLWEEARPKAGSQQSGILLSLTNFGEGGWRDKKKNQKTTGEKLKEVTEVLPRD